MYIRLLWKATTGLLALTTLDNRTQIGAIHRHLIKVVCLMEQCALKNVNSHLNTNIYSYLDIFGGQISNIYLNIVQFFNTSVN